MMGLTNNPPADPPGKTELLQHASALVEEALLRDTFPDLAELHKALPSTTTAGLSPGGLSPYSYLKKESFVQLPSTIMAQYETLQSRSFMGLLPAINRVWITIDSRLYLWDYINDSVNVFDDLNQIVVSVGIVVPVEGVFLEQIEYLLVVSTPLEILLLGIAFSEKDEGNGRGKMNVYRTDMVVSSDNVNMTLIVGTDQGRVFMRGSDFHLYELMYQV